MVAGIEGETPGTATLDGVCQDVFASKLEVLTASLRWNGNAVFWHFTEFTREDDMSSTVKRSSGCREPNADLGLCKRKIENVVGG